MEKVKTLDKKKKEEKFNYFHLRRRCYLSIDNRLHSFYYSNEQKLNKNKEKEIEKQKKLKIKVDENLNRKIRKKIIKKKKNW